MEGVGSRLGRASSRYGPAATVFNGPVRKWKKKWVHVSSSSTVSYQTSQFQPNGHSSSSNNSNSNNNASRLLLCRWTPLTPSTDENGSGATEEPPKRKFRYTPIAVIEELKRAVAEKVEDEPKLSETNQSADLPTSESDELNINKDLKKAQDSNTGNLDLGLCLKGHNGDDDSVSQNKEGKLAVASSSGFWTTFSGDG